MTLVLYVLYSTDYTLNSLMANSNIKIKLSTNVC